MPIQERTIPKTGAERMAGRVRDLERRVDALQRNTNVPNLQRGYSHPSDVSGISGSAAAPTTITTITVNIPEEGYQVMAWWRFDLTVPGATTGVVGIVEDTDCPAPNPYPIAGAYAVGSYTISTGLDNTNTAGSWGAKIRIPAMLYPITGGNGGPTTRTPTPGDRTYELVAFRTVGSGTLTLGGIHFWIAVV